MKIVFSLITLIVIVTVCVGLYRGWFSVSSQDTDGKSNVTLTVDKEKIEADKNKLTDKLKTD